MNSKKLESIQALRGIAALMVMFFHFKWILYGEKYFDIGRVLFLNGAIGVDLFFVISGFIMAYNTDSSKNGLNPVKRFLTNRAVRILPVYYVLLFITFLLCGAMSIFHYEDKAANFISALTFSPIYTYEAPMYLNSSGFFGIRWTLNYEIYFYVIFGLCMLSKYRNIIFYSLCLLSLVIVPALLGHTPTLSAGGYQLNSPYLNMLTNPIIWQFALGVFIGTNIGTLEKYKGKVTFIALYAAIILFTYSFFSGFKAKHGVLEFGLISGIIIALFVVHDEHMTKLTPKWLIKIGDASYSLYLIHTGVLIGIGVRIYNKLDMPKEGVVFFALVSILSILFALLSRKYIEIKLVNAVRNRVDKR